MDGAVQNRIRARSTNLGVMKRR